MRRYASLDRKKEERNGTPWAWIEGAGWVLRPGGTSQPPCITRPPFIPARSCTSRGNNSTAY